MTPAARTAMRRSWCGSGASLSPCSCPIEKGNGAYLRSVAFTNVTATSDLPYGAGVDTGPGGYALQVLFVGWTIGSSSNVL